MRKVLALLAAGVMISIPVATEQPGPQGASLNARVVAAAVPATTPQVIQDIPFPPPTPDPAAIAAAKQASVAALLPNASGGRLVPVIVGFDASFVPEGRLSADRIAAQHASIATVREAILGQMLRGSISGLKAFETIPYLAAHADAEALQTLASLDRVTSIQEDEAVPPTLKQSVPLIQAPTVWNYRIMGAGWAAAILDSGVDKTHPFLAGKVISEACYSTSSASNGSTSVCPGGASSSTASGSGVNCSLSILGCAHGTHVAGITAGNGPSFAGVAPSASIIAIQVFSRFEASNCIGGGPCALSWNSDRILGLQRVLALSASTPIASVNMSLGEGRHYANCDVTLGAIKAAIDNLRSVGIATVISSGNNGYRDSMNQPGCVSTAVSVGATTKSDVVASYSNSAWFVHLLAPGSAINSSVPGGGFASWDGTSMAAPHVAGAWVLLKNAFPSASVTSVLAALRSTGVPVHDAPTAGSGLTFPRIRVFDAAVALVGGGGGTAPGAPRSLTGSASGWIISLSWSAPGTGDPPTSYVIQAGSGPGQSNLANSQTGSRATSFQGAARNGTYYVRVLATNAAGISGPSNEVVVVVGDGGCTVPPGAAGGLTIAENSGGNVAFTWSEAPGGPTTYLLEAGSAPGLANLLNIDLGGIGTTFATSGVSTGTYYVRVRAANACGIGGPSNEVVLVKTSPRVIELSGNLAFGSVPVGTTATATLTISNSGTSPLTVRSISYPAGFSGMWSGTVAAGGSQIVTVTFAPTAANRYVGMVTVNANQTSGTPTILASGTGTVPVTRIIGLTGNLAFGDVAVGTTATATLTVSNSGTSMLTVSGISYPEGFSGAWTAKGVPAGGSQNVTVTFAPTAAANYGGTVTVNANQTSGTPTISASGTGTAESTRIIGLNGNLAFGNVPVGTTATAILTITNGGTSTLTVSSISYPEGFSGAWNGTVAAGASHSVTVTFAPSNLISYGGTITVNANQTSGTPTISVSGTGTPTPSPAVATKLPG